MCDFPDYPEPGRFSWEHYLDETGSTAVPADAFKVVCKWRIKHPILYYISGVNN